jgi:hypothetical protein
MSPNWDWFGVFRSLGRIISDDAAVGPETSIETKAGFASYRSANAVKNVLKDPWYKAFHGIGRTPPPPSTKPTKVAFPQFLGGVCGGDLNRPSQLGI